MQVTARIDYAVRALLELASSGLFCLQYPDHSITHEISRAAARLME